MRGQKKVTVQTSSVIIGQTKMASFKVTKSTNHTPGNEVSGLPSTRSTLLTQASFVAADRFRHSFQVSILLQHFHCFGLLQALSSTVRQLQKMVSI